MWKGKRFAELFSDKRILKVAVIIGITAIALIFLTSFVDFSPDRSSNISEQYAKKTEQRLLDIITHIDGVGKAEIFLTMDNSGENVYQKNSDKKTVSIEPQVRGVVVVCEGGEDPTVAARVLEAVTKSLCISSDKVCITK